MSRHTTRLNDTTQVHSGGDHALGRFIDITDSRYADSGKDEQGEGYLVEWSQLFGFSQNQIGIKVEELPDRERIFELVDAFVDRLNNKS